MTTARIAPLAAFGVAEYGGAVAIATVASDTGATSEVVTAFALGFSFTATGVLAVARRPENRTGLLMLLAGFLWAFGVLTLTDSPLLFSIGAVTQQLALAPLAWLLLAYPSGLLDGVYHRRLVQAMWVVAFAGPVAISLVDRTPTGCASCAESVFTVAASHAGTVVAEAGYATAASALALAIVVELARKYRSAGAPLRRTLSMVYATFLVALVLLGVANVVAAVSGPAGTTVSAIAVVCIALVPVAFLAGLLRSRLARGSVLPLLVALESGTPLRDALRAALGDPSLEIAYRVAGGRWVDVQGREMPEPVVAGRRSVSTVERHGERIAALVHDASLDDEPELVRGVVAAAALALGAQRTQAELRNQYALLSALVDTTPSLLVTVDLDGRIVTHNGAALEAVGAGDDGEIRGRCFWDVFVDRGERDAMRARFAGAAPEHPAAEYENAFTNLRGERRVVFWRAAPVRDEEGRTVSIVAGGLDVTERLQREEAVREAEERLRAVIESAPVAIVEIGLDDRVNLWNPAAERIFGWTADEVLGGPPRWVPGDYLEEFRALSAREALGGGYTGYETVRVRSDGRRIDVEIAAAPIRDADGTVVGAMAVIGDISDRRRQEEEVRASRARIVRTADETRRKLERNLHDGAQQRLVALSVALRLAEVKLGSDPAGAAGVLTEARAELASALEELRELARGLHPAVLTERGLAAAVEALVGRTPLRVTAEVPDVRLPAATEAALYYVIAESLTNVVKYAPGARARVRLDVSDAGLATAEVDDDGPGGADPARGSGLRGLADRVAALDGELVVESPPGGGTHVRAAVPLASARAQAPPPAPGRMEPAHWGS